MEKCLISKKTLYKVTNGIHFQMRKALQDQQDVNLHLRKYIDSVLLNIMEKYPELLEVRGK